MSRRVLYQVECDACSRRKESADPLTLLSNLSRTGWSFRGPFGELCEICAEKEDA